jgi:predicted DNA-binding transcriptional regulator AlpA
MNKQLELFRYKDLYNTGYGNRNTVIKRIKAGTFPAPLDDGNGRPVWTREMIDEYKASLKDYESEQFSAN